MAYWKRTGEKIQCLICPHNCKVSEGRSGICGVRKNNGKEIELATYGVISGYSLDPIEKKPLYHFYPGKKILSAGSYGCNMRCDFCQNYNISQNTEFHGARKMSPADIVKEASSVPENIGLAFTYNEPTISFEFIRDTGIAAKNAGMKTVLVSNGYVNSEPLSEIIGFIDAFNIDLKAFNESSYKALTGAHLEPVKSTLKQIAFSGRHLEITSLIIPGYNDKPEEMEKQTEWISGELGNSIPLHLSRYYPMYKRDDPATSFDVLDSLYEIASQKLKFVYMGNTNKGQDTRCPGCNKTVTSRSGYNIRLLDLDEKGRCSNCGTLIYSDFTFSSKKES
ncbi:MAG TPA: AmmeMemoRadiSam system radical SAM enzyme [Bacteroidales bacterium]|nr:AmmeMemoRadiSam system radical SAM enzyme [Bacteroidales bacterium]